MRGLSTYHFARAVQQKLGSMPPRMVLLHIAELTGDGKLLVQQNSLSTATLRDLLLGFAYQSIFSRSFSLARGIAHQASSVDSPIAVCGLSRPMDVAQILKFRRAG